MKLTERTVHFYDLLLSSSTRQPDISNPGCAPIEAVLDAVVASLSRGEEIRSSSTDIVEISDWGKGANGREVYILLNRADRAVSDVSFKDFNSKTRRRANKTRTEGIETSCHVVIRPNADHRTALLLMTMGSGISASAIANFLRARVAELKKDPSNKQIFSFALPSGETLANGQPATYQVRYRFEVVAHRSVLLDEALAGGRFLSMELIAHEYEQFDAGGNLQIKKQSVFIEASNAQSVTGAFLTNTVRRYMRSGPPHQFDQARIRYVGSNGKPSATTLATNDLDAAFTKKENISLPQEVDAHQSRLSRVIIDEMRRLN